MGKGNHMDVGGFNLPKDKTLMDKMVELNNEISDYQSKIHSAIEIQKSKQSDYEQRIEKFNR